MQRRILGPGFTDGEGGHRHPARHLGDGEKRIQAFQGARLNRHAQHRQSGHAGDHAGQMRRPARAGDDDFQAAPAGAFGIRGHAVRGAMSRDDAAFIAHAQRRQHIGGQF